MIDLREFPQEQQESLAQQQATEEVQQPFDLERGPLLRVKLVRLWEDVAVRIPMQTDDRVKKVTIP